MIWQLWQSITAYSQSDPIRFVEVLMLSLAIGLMAVWSLTEQWPYLVLSLSFAIGASVSVLIREAFLPSRLRLAQVTALVLLGLSFYALIDLIRYF